MRCWVLPQVSRDSHPKPLQGYAVSRLHMRPSRERHGSLSAFFARVGVVVVSLTACSAAPVGRPVSPKPSAQPAASPTPSAARSDVDAKQASAVEPSPETETERKQRFLEAFVQGSVAVSECKLDAARDAITLLNQLLKPEDSPIQRAQVLELSASFERDQGHLEAARRDFEAALTLIRSAEQKRASFVLLLLRGLASATPQPEKAKVWERWLPLVEGAAAGSNRGAAEPTDGSHVPVDAPDVSAATLELLHQYGIDDTKDQKQALEKKYGVLRASSGNKSFELYPALRTTQRMRDEYFRGRCAPEPVARPGTGVDVKVPGADAVIEGLREEIAACAAGGSSASLFLLLRLDAAGRVVYTEGTAIGVSAEILSCTLDAARRQQFEPPIGATAVLEVPVTVFTSRDWAEAP
jgi:hypothetical protein